MTRNDKIPHDMVPDGGMSEAEKQAFLERLSAQYRTPLVRYFRRHMADGSEAEDMAQEVFVRTLHKVGAARIENAEAFLFSVAVNLLRDRARRAKTRSLGLAEITDQPNNAEAFTPERVVLGKESLQTVLAALDKVGEKSKDIFILHRLENMKYHEIADLYGISVSAVEKHMIKALAHLARYMDLK